jgi:hypothetical protein
MDIAKIAQEHPKLLTSILAKSTGAIGEVLVADKLSSLGYRHSAQDPSMGRGALVGH